MLRVEDSASSDDGAHHATRLVLEDDPAVILGELSSVRTVTVAATARSARVPVLSPNASDPRVLDLDGIHSLARSEGVIGSIAGQFLVSKKWLDMAGLADRQSGASWLYAPRKVVQRAGGRLVSIAPCPRHQASYHRALAQLRRGSPHAVVASCHPADAPTILGDARDVGLIAPFVAGPEWDTGSVIAAPALDGTYLITYFHRDDPVAADFVAAYEAAHGAAPTGLAALAHDAATVAIDAIARARALDPLEIEAALDRETDALVLATGARGTMAIVQISGGTTVFIDRL